MGKSPGKWIKSVLFGKKSSKSNAGKDSVKAGSIKGTGGGKTPASAEGSPVISEPVLVSTHNSASIPGIQVVESSGSSNNGEALPTTCKDIMNDGLEKPAAVSVYEKNREEQAAVQLQAAFRGYLARRAFYALKGIIRLQALIRGHLVRRQAISTLRATWFIVKVQARVRGSITRKSNIGHDILLKLQQTEFKKTPISWKDKLSSNAYIRRLLSLPIILEPLHFQYDQKDSNSAFSWLERWTACQFWRPASQPRKTGETKSSRKASYVMETESGKLKRNVRRVSSSTIEPSQANTCSEPEKLKRQLKKLSTPGGSTDAAQDNHISELEKVKRSLRKVTSSMAEASDRSVVESHKPSRKRANSNAEHLDSSAAEIVQLSPSVQEVPNLVENPEPANGAISDGVKVDTLIFQTTASLADERIDELPDNQVCEVVPLQKTASEETITVKEELMPPSSDTIKSGRRRSSFSGKSENVDNGSQNTQPVPSYMAATESARAKLRGQISPRLGSDSAEKNALSSAEKNGMTRRHSLPSATNGKLNSNSPRTQRPSPGSGKAANKSERLLLSSRDANDRVVQLEWRR